MLRLSDIKPHNEAKVSYGSSSGPNKYIDENTVITKNGVYLGTMRDVNDGLLTGEKKCDCPIHNPEHNDGTGDGYAHIVPLSGGEYGIHCSGSHCKVTYIMNKPMVAIQSNPFDAVAIKVEPDERITKDDPEWIIKLFKKKHCHVWFDITNDSYVIKSKHEVSMKGKQAFQQIIFSESGLSAGNNINVPVFKGDYRPDQPQFFDVEGQAYANYFTPTSMMGVKGGKSMPKYIGMLLDSLFSEDAEMKDRFLNWLAYIYQYKKRTGVAWVFVGEQGTGKGVLVETIIGGIFGKNMKANVTDSQLDNQFNSYLSNALIVHFNEVSSESRKSRMTVKNRLKTWITDDTIHINQKNVKEYTQSNYCNFIINSNESIPIDIDDGDRRFNVVHTSQVLQGKAWFDGIDIIKEIKGELEDFASHIAGYTVDAKAAKRAYMSDRKKKLVEAVKGIDRLIADALKNRNFDFFEDNGIEDYLMNNNKAFAIEAYRRAVQSGMIQNAYLVDLVNSVSDSKWTIHKITQQIINKHDLISGDEDQRWYEDGKRVRGCRIKTDVAF